MYDTGRKWNIQFRHFWAALISVLSCSRCSNLKCLLRSGFCSGRERRFWCTSCPPHQGWRTRHSTGRRVLLTDSGKEGVHRRRHSFCSSPHSRSWVSRDLLVEGVLHKQSQTCSIRTETFDENFVSQFIRMERDLSSTTTHGAGHWVTGRHQKCARWFRIFSSDCCLFFFSRRRIASKTFLSRLLIASAFTEGEKFTQCLGPNYCRVLAKLAGRFPTTRSPRIKADCGRSAW